MNYTEERPWGKFEVLLDATDCKVKRITINPGQSPSYQYHFKREERWIVVSGKGQVTLNETVFTVGPREVVNVKKEEAHCIKCISEEPLVFIEVQLGEYFGEDDIVRLKDNYGRV